MDFCKPPRCFFFLRANIFVTPHLFLISQKIQRRSHQRIWHSLKRCAMSRATYSCSYSPCPAHPKEKVALLPSQSLRWNLKMAPCNSSFLFLQKCVITTRQGEKHVYNSRSKVYQTTTNGNHKRSTLPETNIFAENRGLVQMKYFLSGPICLLSGVNLLLVSGRVIINYPTYLPAISRGQKNFNM